MQDILFNDIFEIKGELKCSPFIHPTNSCYGIGGNIYSEDVYQQIYIIKERSKEKPFFITVRDRDMLETLTIYDNRIQEFIAQYPNKIFTFILPRTENIPSYINPGLQTIGIQIATGPLLRLFNHVDFPIFGTSANISGQDTIYTSSQIRETFGHHENLLFLDMGDLPFKEPSIIIDLTKKEYQILRGSLL